MTDKERAKELVLEYIRNHKGTSFVEIENLFERNNYDYKGDYAPSSNKFSNVVYWIGWKEEASDILAELEEENKICRGYAKHTYMIYLIDGKVPSLPVAKQMRDYKALHWLPCVFNAKGV